jgi:membrane protein
MPDRSPSRPHAAAAALQPPGVPGAWKPVTQNYWRDVRQAIDQWFAHEGPRLAAALSLYSLLSLAPLVILSISIASIAFGHQAAQDALINQVGELMGSDGARAIQTVIEYAKVPRADGMASAVGIVILLFGASSVFGELQSALNKIWEVPPTPGYGVLALVRSRLFSFALVLGFGFLLVVSLVLSTVLAAFARFFSSHLPLAHVVLIGVDALISIGGIFVLIALILRYVPDVALRWRDVWQGALATALLFTVGKALLGVYLGRTAVGSAYGAAGSLVVVIVWVYYSAMIFYFGAELTRVRAAGASAALRQESH